MKKFNVEIKETISNTFEIEAETKEEAEQKDIDGFYNREYILDPVEPKVEAKVELNSEKIEKGNYFPKYPVILMKDRDVVFLKYENDTSTFYSVDINNNSVGTTICFTKDLNEAKNIYNKEKFFNRIQRVDYNIINNINYINSTFGQDYNKAIICDEKIFGRRTNLIDYFRNELAHVDEFYSDEEDNIDKELFIKKTTDIIEELNNSSYQLEPVYLHLQPMDNTFHIMNNEEQLENIKNLYDDVYTELLELPDSEESDDEEL